MTLSKDAATAEATDPDMMTLGALKRIEEIVRKRNRPFKKFVWKASARPPAEEMRLADFLLVILMAGLFAGLVVLLSPEKGTNELRLGVGWTVVISSLIVLAFATMFGMTTTRQAIVVPRSQKDAPPFFDRNRDQLVVNAIFAVVGAALGVVGTLLVQAFSQG